MKKIETAVVKFGNIEKEISFQFVIDFLKKNSPWTADRLVACDQKIEDEVARIIELGFTDVVVCVSLMMESPKSITMGVQISFDGNRKKVHVTTNYTSQHDFTVSNNFYGNHRFKIYEESDINGVSTPKSIVDNIDEFCNKVNDLIDKARYEVKNKLLEEENVRLNKMVEYLEKTVDELQPKTENADADAEDED